MRDPNFKGSWFRFLAVWITGLLMAAAFLGANPSPARGGEVVEGAPVFDAGIANIDRLAVALENRGLIPKELDPEGRDQAVRQYLNRRAQAARLRAEKNAGRDGHSQRLRNEAGVHVQTPTAPAVDQTWDGSTRTDKLLVLLIEYSDFTHNRIQPSETDMYFTDYPREHFQRMLFSDTGYTGPNGENFISTRQYFLQQSGGSYTVEGEVFGWYQAPETAAYYGGNGDEEWEIDSHPADLVYRALLAAIAGGVNLAEYDQEDQYDIDGDGNLREADGLVDHLMVIHAGVGEEAGGGSLGPDAIWSHSSSLGSVRTFPGTTAAVPYWGGMMGAYGYTMTSEDSNNGTFGHEFAHDLGLPDEYDTIYSGGGEPVEYFSMMSSGSWAGLVAGAEAPGFSPYAKELFQASMGGNWLHGKSINLAEIPLDGMTLILDQATTKGANEDVIRIDLPDQVVAINTPPAGTYSYWGGTGDEIDHTMSTTIDLSGATSAALSYDTWYDIESNWDFAFVQVSTDGGRTWSSLSTPNTSSALANDGYPAIRENLPGYTGRSNGWLHETIDLSPFAGRAIKLQFRYMTDWGTLMAGFFVDNLTVTKNGDTLLADGAEGATAFTLNGYARHTGTYTAQHYYLVEWRNHHGVDMGLAHIKRGLTIISYDPGMVIWYVNGAYNNNWVGVHPGRGFLGVVDAHQNVHHWGGAIAQGALAGTRYQIYDAAFSLTKGADLEVSYGQFLHLKGAARNPVPAFDDRSHWWSPSSLYSGLMLPTYGLRIEVVGEAPDRSAATIKITR